MPLPAGVEPRIKKNGRPAKPVGRRTALTDETEAKILAAVRNHQRLPVAAPLAGVSYSALMHWRQMGVEARIFMEDGGRLSALSSLERRCLEFVEKLEKADAEAEGLAVRSWLAAGINRQKTTKTVRKVIGTDDAGQPIYATETTEEERPGDWRAVESWLERRRPDYRRSAEVEVNVDVHLRAAGLAERVRAHQEGRTIAAESRET